MSVFEIHPGLFLILAFGAVAVAVLFLGWIEDRIDKREERKRRQRIDSDWPDGGCA